MVVADIACCTRAEIRRWAALMRAPLRSSDLLGLAIVASPCHTNCQSKVSSLEGLPSQLFQDGQAQLAEATYPTLTSPVPGCSLFDVLLWVHREESSWLTCDGILAWHRNAQHLSLLNTLC